MADEEELRRDRQEDEFAALQSIYSGDVVDLRKNDAWQVRRPPEMLFSLRPQQSNTMTEAHARIHLYIKCPIAYPNVIPVIDLRNPKGLSDRKIKDLLEQLVEIARARVGEEMIYELCSQVECFLHDNNLPPRPSFYDEMINEQKRLKEERAREDEKRHEMQRQLEELQLKDLEEQLKRKEQERKENARRMRDVAKQLSIDRRSAGDTNAVFSEAGQFSSYRPRSSLSPKSSVAENQYNSQSTRLISTMISTSTEPETENRLQQEEKAVTLKFSADKERIVHRGRCIGGSARGSRVFAGMDAETGALVAVTQWEIRWSLATGPGNKENNLHAKYKGQVLSIEKELLSLVRLSHSNLVLYLGINHETKQQNIKVNVLSEFYGGGNLETSVRCRNPLPLDRIRSYIQQTLEGLAYLHGKAIIHRDLRLSSLLLDASGKVRMADYSIHKRLADLVEEAENPKQRETSTDVNRSTLVKSDGKKDDIFQLGLVTLSLAVGANMNDLPTDLPSHLPVEFIDFLKQCVEVDEGLRWSAIQLLDHAFIKTPVYVDISVSGGSFRSRSSSAFKKRPASSKAKEGDNSDEVVDSLLLQSISSESRLKKEFKILRRIGKGGFGDVIKVRNLLDNRCYAIKRISLKPAWHKQYKKLTREVEVLSKLNHENIVRYFNSWLETCEDNSSSDDTSSSHTNTDSDTAEDEEEMSETPSYSSSVESVIRRKTKSISQSLSEELNDDGLSQMAPPCDAAADDDDSSSDDSSSSDDTDIEDVFGQSRRWMSTQDSDEEDSIIFEENSKDNDASLERNIKVVPRSVKKDRSQQKTRTRKHPKKRQFLYIQMEFCEKSTLRDCIDTKYLYRDVNRVWELFREIVEGLAHIHDQGIIHRDLKPVNIFLDSEYHVKIGDFGLATAFMDIVAEPPGVVSDVPSKQKKDLGLQEEETSLTGKVGTVLYVSPEMESTTKRYNLKVDIYSLGIIFFEMCYRPFTTGMERIKVLTNIRKESIDFPDDFHEVCLPDQAIIIRLLLTHDPFKRPSAKELLKSEYLPLSQMEESELYEVLDSTISNPEGRTYKHMLHKIFVQPVLTVTDFLYDADLLKTSFTRNQALVQQTVAATLERIFQHHGAIRFSIPLLMPTSLLYNNCETYVIMMDCSGGLVSLPYDTMVPFARFIARAKVPHNFKRYSIDRVFRECRPSGVHPRELWAASFDIVRSPSGALLDDVEVIYTVYEITREFPLQSSCSYRLRINHASLLRAVLLHCGVPDEDCPQVCGILGDSSMDRQIQRQKLLSIESLSEICVDLIYSFLQREDVFDKISSFLKCISKTKTQAASLTKKSLNDIETVISHLSALGCTLEPLVSLSLVSNVRSFSGILFQVMLEGKRKKKATLGVLAAGGRYDNLVATFRKPTERLSGCPQAVGVSIAFDKVVSLAVDSGHLNVAPLTEVLICAVGCQLKKEVLIAAQHFWDLGVAADIFQDASQALDDVKIHCHKNKIPYLLTLTAKDENQKEWTLIKMQEDKDRVLKKDKVLKEIAEFFQKIHSTKGEAAESIKLQTSQVQSPSETTSVGGIGGGGGGGSNSVSLASCNVTFILPESKESNRLQKNTKRAYETQIYAAISRTLPYLNPKSRVEVIATELPANVLKALVTHFDVNKDDASLLSTIGVKEGQKATSKKYISRVISEIKDNRSQLKAQTPIILYSLADEFHRVLLL